MRVRNTKNVIFSTAFLLLASAILSVAFADCPLCESQKADIEKKEKERDRLLKIKKLNEDYLLNHKVTPSLSIKINSNIMISSARSETMENEIEFLRAKNNTDCAGCP